MSVMMSRKCTSAYQPGLGGPLRVRLQGALQGVHDAPAFPRLGTSRTAGGPRVASRKLGCKEAARRVAGTPEHAGHDRNTTEGPGRAGSRNTRETSTGTSEPEHHRIRRLTLGGACVDDANVHEDPCVGLGTVAVGGPGAVTALAYDARRRYPRPPPRATARPRSATTTTTLWVRASPARPPVLRGVRAGILAQISARTELLLGQSRPVLANVPRNARVRVESTRLRPRLGRGRRGDAAEPPVLPGTHEDTGANFAAKDDDRGGALGPWAVSKRPIDMAVLS